MEDWRPAPRSKQEDCVYTKGRKQYRVQHGQFCSKVFDTAAAAKKLGWQEYEEWQDNKAKDAARGVAKPPAAAAAAKPRRKQARKRKASPDASTDGILQLEIKQPLPQAAAAAAGPPKGRKRGQQAAPAAAAQNKRQKKNNAASPAVRAGSQLATAFAQGDIPAEQTPSAATDAATMPQGKARKQPRKQPQHAAADADVPQAAAVDQRPAQAANKKRHRQAAAPAAAEAPPPAAAAAAAGGKSGRRPKRAVRRPAAAAREAEEGTDGDVQEGPAAAAAAAAEELYPGVPRDARGRVKPFGRVALQAMARARIIPPPAARARREAAAAKKGRQQSFFDSEDEEEEEDSQEDSEQQQQQGRKKPQHRRQQAAAATDSHGLTGTGMDWEQKASLGQADTHTTSLSQESSEDYESEDSDLAPSSAAAAAAMQQQEPPPRTSESAGSNWVPPELPAAAAAVAAGGQHAPAAVAAVAPGEASTLHVWYQGSKSATCEGITLDLQFQQQLGKGGFGAVHKVLVKATGANSLAGLKLKGSLGNSLKTLIKEGRTKGNVGRGAAAAAGGGGSRQQSARSRAGSKGGGSNGGGSVGSNGGGGGGSWVPMALKVALGFEQLSREMQDNFREASAFDTNVQQRMREEYDVMAACAASPHILDAFCMGTAWMGGSWRPCILMELSALGDAERVFITPANTLYGTGPRGVSAVVAQRIVRQAAVALKDLHSMAGSIHLDLKVNNLLVFGSKDAPQVKLCDFGCAKKRSDEPRYGPASGTKDWQAPEQMAADAQDGPVAGRLDFCTDSWALGLLVLGLRKGQQPFWWLKQEGKLPSEMPDALRSSLSSPSSPYAQDSLHGSKLTRAELAFVTTCMASSSSSRPDVRDLLDHQSYLSSRYRGG